MKHVHSPATFLNAPVQLLININAESANQMAVDKCF